MIVHLMLGSLLYHNFNNVIEWQVVCHSRQLYIFAAHSMQSKVQNYSTFQWVNYTISDGRDISIKLNVAIHLHKSEIYSKFISHIRQKIKKKKICERITRLLPANDRLKWYLCWTVCSLLTQECCVNRESMCALMCLDLTLVYSWSMLPGHYNFQKW